jgi:hypothetical protein
MIQSSTPWQIAIEKQPLDYSSKGKLRHDFVDFAIVVSVVGDRSDKVWGQTIHIVC